jgi:Co/Zn/Cd efflux system component
MRCPRTIVAMPPNLVSTSDHHSSRLVVVSVMTAVVMVAGWWAHSLAVIADAGHVFEPGGHLDHEMSVRP